MKKNIIFNNTLEKYNKKYRNYNHRLLKLTKKEIEEFNKINKTKDDYLLKGRKWYLIGDTYYEIPKAPRWVWFRNLKTSVQFSVVAVATAGVASAVTFPILTNTIWKPIPATYNVTLNAKKVGYFDEKQQTKTFTVEQNTLLKDVIKDVKPTSYLEGTFDKYTFDIIGKKDITEDYKINSDLTIYAQYSYLKVDKTILLYSNYTDSTSIGRKVSIKTEGEATIDWGDQFKDTGKDEVLSHHYGSNGTYTITVEGNASICLSGESNDNEVGLLSEGNKHIVGLVLSTGATEIPANAFNGVSDLTEVYISEKGVKSIGDSAFNDCSYLYSIGIPKQVTSIGESAFKGCNSLESVIIGDGVSTIGNNAFSGLSNLEYIFVGEGNTTYTSRDHNDKEINSIIKNKTGSETGDTLLFGSSNTVIPETVTKIADNALVNNNKIESIEIPSSVTEIGENNFTGCGALKSIKVDSKNEKYTSQDNGEEINAIMTKVEGELIVAVDGSKIPDAVTVIKPYACANMNDITTFKWPKNLKRIGEYAFYKCSNLLNIEIPGTIEEIGYVKDSQKLNPETVFKGCGNVETIKVAQNDKYTDLGADVLVAKATVEKPDSLEIIRGCANTDFTKLNDCTSINDFAFDGTMLTLLPLLIPYTIDLSNSKITNIGVGAFAFCGGIGSIKLPSNLKTIKENTFQLCLYLKEVTMPTCEYTIGQRAFGHCMLLKKIDLTNATSIGNEAFSSNFSLSHITFGSKLEEIREKAFEYCFNRETEETPEIIFKDSEVKELKIYDLAFQYCTYLKEVTFPASAKKFGSAIFAHCDNLVKCDLSKVKTMVTSLETAKGPSSTFKECQHYMPKGIGKIIVPSDLLSTYRADKKKWAVYSSHFVSAPSNI